MTSRSRLPVPAVGELSVRTREESLDGVRGVRRHVRDLVGVVDVREAGVADEAGPFGLEGLVTGREQGPVDRECAADQVHRYAGGRGGIGQAAGGGAGDSPTKRST